jgi:3-oxoadipate enol-lactonase
MTSRLHIEEIGSGRPLVMLHGCPGWGGLFRRTAKHLEGRRVLLPDMPGYGRSPRLDGAYSFDRVLALLEDALLERGVTEAGVVGFSLGGYRALQLALSGRVKVADLVLIGTPADLDEAGRTMRREAAELIRGSETFEAPFFYNLMKDLMVSPGYPEREPERFAEVLEWLQQADVQGFADEVEGMAAMPGLLDRLEALTIPVHVIHGELDAGLPLAASEAIVERIKGATLQVLPGIGHSVPIEAADELARAIAQRA